MVKYKEIGSETLERINEDGSLSYIPMDPANSDYAKYLEDLESSSSKAAKAPVIEEPVAPEAE